MSTIEEKTSIIKTSPIARRIKRELEIMVKSGICQDSNISISRNTIYNTNEFEYHIILYNDKDNRHYEFIINSYYPFKPPKLILNGKPYSEYFRFTSDNFRHLFNKYKGDKCFCCQTILCSDNWGPQLTLTNIMNEVNEFHNDCKDISNIIISNVIKRKYLVDDINLIEWLC